MSTTFGVTILSDNGDEEVEVAFRSHYVKWLNPLARLLPDDTEVTPLDNTAQGINTIGDIREQINSQKNGRR